MSTHEEFPELTPEAQAAAVISLGYSIDRVDSVEVHRRYRSQLAAFLREAMKQATQGNCSPFFELKAIAASLHNPPPPPPTREQMEQALQNLLSRTDDPAGCHEGSFVAEWADTIRRGITHYCKVQP